MSTSTHDERTPRGILVVLAAEGDAAVPAQAIRAHAYGPGPPRVTVVAPALGPRLRRWTSDEDEARRRAGRRLRECLDRLAGAGVEARGRVGDADPLLAIQDALHLDGAEVVLIATDPETSRRDRALVARARARFGRPVVRLGPPVRAAPTRTRRPALSPATGGR